MTYGLDVDNTNVRFIKQIGLIQSEEYSVAVQKCLISNNANGKYSFVDVSCVDKNSRKDEDWGVFDHVYYYEKDGESYVYIPITQKLYLKTHIANNGREKD